MFCKAENLTHQLHIGIINYNQRGRVDVLMLVLPDKILEKYRERQSFEEIKSSFTSAMVHEMKKTIAIIQNQCECILENIAPDNNNEYVSSIY